MALFPSSRARFVVSLMVSLMVSLTLLYLLTTFYAPAHQLLPASHWSSHPNPLNIEKSKTVDAVVTTAADADADAAADAAAVEDTPTETQTLNDGLESIVPDQDPKVPPEGGEPEETDGKENSVSDEAPEVDQGQSGEDKPEESSPSDEQQTDDSDERSDADVAEGHGERGRPSILRQDSRLAIVTFLDDTDYLFLRQEAETKHNDAENTSPDSFTQYLTNVRILTYQLLYAHETKIPPSRRSQIDWVVTVTSNVPGNVREQLTNDGATVVELSSLPVAGDVKIGEPRWTHVLDKLRLFAWDHYDRILFLDADMILQGPLDDIFFTQASLRPQVTDPDYAAPFDFSSSTSPDVVASPPTLPPRYVMAGRPDLAYMAGHEHAVPDDPANMSDYMNAGFFLFAPDPQLFAYMSALLTVPGDRRPFHDNMVEQNVLNYVFRRCDVLQGDGQRCGVTDAVGPMPWTDVSMIWSSNRASTNDQLIGVRALHYKGWATKEGHPLRTLWDTWKGRMEVVLGPADV